MRDSLPYASVAGGVEREGTGLMRARFATGVAGEEDDESEELEEDADGADFADGGRGGSAETFGLGAMAAADFEDCVAQVERTVLMGEGCAE